jgi:hypothetical protein
LFIAAIIWLDEWLDIPHMLFGAPATPFRWHEAVWESTLVLLFGTLVVLYTARLLLRYLNRFIVLCAWCHRARLDERWVSVEEFLKAHHAETSHGMCPECAVRFEAEHAGAA